MTAVWLNDELMLSPALVAGLRMRVFTDSFGSEYQVWVEVDAIIQGVDEPVSVWSDRRRFPIGDGGQLLTHAVNAVIAKLRPVAEAEMARLSALLWPPKPDVPWTVNRYADSPRIYDPELYGLPVCEASRTLPSSDPEHCNLAANHPGPHRWGLTFDEAHPAPFVHDGSGPDVDPKTGDEAETMNP